MLIAVAQKTSLWVYFVFAEMFILFYNILNNILFSKINTLRQRIGGRSYAKQGTGWAKKLDHFSSL